MNRSPLNILIVDDGLANQKLVAGLLKRFGHYTTTADNGAEAMEFLEAAKFDLIFLDVQMPVMDGFETIRKIRLKEQETGLHQQVIALTAMMMKGDVERLLESGMDDVLNKPIRPSELEQLLERQYLRLEEEQSMRDDKIIATPESTRHAFSLEIVGGDLELFMEVTEAFLDELPDLLNSTEAALEANNPESLRRAVHTIKGGTRIFGETKANMIATQMEDASKEHNLPTASQLYEKLKTALDELKIEIHSFLAENE